MGNLLSAIPSHRHNDRSWEACLWHYTSPLLFWSHGGPFWIWWRQYPLVWESPLCVNYHWIWVSQSQAYFKKGTGCPIAINGRHGSGCWKGNLYQQLCNWGGCDSPSSPPSPSPTLKRVKYRFAAGWTERVIETSRAQAAFWTRDLQHQWRVL